MRLDQVFGIRGGRAPTIRITPTLAGVLGRSHLGWGANGQMEWLAYPYAMMAVAQKWLVYNTWKLFVGDGTVNLSSDVFKAILLTSASNCETLTFDEYGDLTGELTTANGYTVGGFPVAVTWTEAAGVVTFDSADPTWNAAGGSITARFCVLYDDTPTPTPLDPIVCYSLLDDTPADVTATTGNTFAVNVDNNGVYDLSGGDTP